MRRTVIRAATGLGRLLLPPHCVVCGRPLGRWASLCAACRRDLPLVGPRTCPRCSRPLGPHLRVGTDCVECRRLPLAHLTAVAAAGVHEGGLRAMILQFKARQQRDLTRTVAGLVYEGLCRRPWLEEVQVLVPVPIHWRRRWWRGFNQGAVLAAALAGHVGRPVAPRALRRIRNTPSQVGLGVQARLKNVAGSIRLHRGAHLRGAAAVLLVDDVMTTGATLSECARVLRRAGVRRVYGAVIAVRHRAVLVVDDADAET